MKIWGWSGWAAGWLVVAALGAVEAYAQTPTTTVQDTVTDASGAGAAGTVVVSWGAFTTSAGSSVAAGSLSATLGAGGALSIPLQPNAEATPMGSYYTAVFHLSDGTTSREFWVVPTTASGTVKLASIRNQVLPTSLAMQTVSKQYVDTTVAKAMAGITPTGSLPWVVRSGDAMTGPLALPGDPVSSMQAADKHYVDAAVAGVSGGGGSASGTAGGDLSGTYPNPTVNAVHAASGTVKGYYNGIGVGGSSATASQPIFGVMNSAQTGYGPGHASFTVLDTQQVSTYNSVLDDGTGNLALPGTLVVGTATAMPRGSSFSSIPANFSAIGYISNTGISGHTWYGNGFMFSGSATDSAFSLVIGSDGRAYFGTVTPTSSGAALVLTPGGALLSAHNTLDDSTGNGFVTGWWAATGFQETLTTPASSSASCTAGQFTDDANFHYVCVSANTWKRAALAAF